jgi:hypothetical protein
MSKIPSTQNPSASLPNHCLFEIFKTSLPLPVVPRKPSVKEKHLFACSEKQFSVKEKRLFFQFNFGWKIIHFFVSHKKKVSRSFISWHGTANLLKGEISDDNLR